MTRFGKIFFTIIILILVLVVLLFLNQDFTKEEIQNNIDNSEIVEEEVEEKEEPAFDKDLLEGEKDDLVSFSILPNSKVSGIISYRGSIRGGWFFEGNILINVLDEEKNVLLNSNAVATTDWMTEEPVDFEGNIDFSTLPKGDAFIEIHNDNPSDGEGVQKFIQIPIIIE
jgi:hypothetical protein